MTRTWHKVDSLGWLDGSIRTDLTIEERSIWADFLAFCSVSRVEGIICRGENRPYDLHTIASRLNIDEGLLTSAIAKFKQEGMISIDGAGIRITKWGKYNPPVVRGHKAYQQRDSAKPTGTKEPDEEEEDREPTPEELQEEAYKLHMRLPTGRASMTPEEIARAEAWEAKEAQKAKALKAGRVFKH